MKQRARLARSCFDFYHFLDILRLYQEDMLGDMNIVYDHMKKEEMKNLKGASLLSLEEMQ